jgi:outer membrane protein assembly factor BamE
MRLRELLISIALLSTPILSGCSLFTVHRIDIQQGNALDPAYLEQLQLGMTSEQVRFILGEPLVRDPFRRDRWDYVYALTPGEGKPERHRVTIWFDDDRVVKIEDSGLYQPES